MPWKEVCMEEERLKFVGMYLEQVYTMSELCGEFGISRKTGYKLVSRYEAIGVEGLIDRSHANHHHANAVSEEIEKEILALKTSRPSWGARKLRGYLLGRDGGKHDWRDLISSWTGDSTWSQPQDSGLWFSVCGLW